MNRDLLWYRSKSSLGSGTCVEVARDGDEWLLRNSREPDGPWLRFTPGEWEAFRLGVNAGEFRL